MTLWSQVGTVLRRAVALFSELLLSVALLPLEAIIFVGYSIVTVVATLGLVIAAAVFMGLVYVLSLLLFFLPGLVDLLFLLAALLMIFAFALVPCFLGAITYDLASPPDWELLPGPNNKWSFPIVLPVVPVIVVILYPDLIAGPWSGVLDYLAAGAVAGSFLYRSCAYVLLSEQSSPASSDLAGVRGSQEPLARRIDTFFPSADRVVPMACTTGIGWLVAALVVLTCFVIHSDLGGLFVDLVLLVPSFPETRLAAVAVPVALGTMLVGVWGLRSIALVAATRRDRLAAVARQLRTLALWLLAQLRLLFVVTWRWFEYVVLLRP